MEKKTVKYTGKKTINVTLNSSTSTEIDEVVVTGYQNIQRRDIVGSITSIKAKDIIMPSFTTIDQMLQGRVAGMVVTNTSSRVLPPRFRFEVPVRCKETVTHCG